MIYANDVDKHAVHWLSKLPLDIDVVDGRDIREIQGHEVAKYWQAHFFAGIGGWPLALDMAGWPMDITVWTGSCPCQPFSAAGKRKGVEDERHLWPEFRRLINECRPPVVIGEQVASKAGRDWLATVRADLEDMGYAVGAADLCAAGVGAPHIRQRLFWVAYRSSTGLEKRSEQSARKERQATQRSSDDSGLAHATSSSGPKHERESRGRQSTSYDATINPCNSGRMGDTNSQRQSAVRGVSEGARVVAERSIDDRLGDSQSNGGKSWSGLHAQGAGGGRSMPSGAGDGVANADGGQSRQRGPGRVQPCRQHGQQPQDGSFSDGLANGISDGREPQRNSYGSDDGNIVTSSGQWDDVIHIPCRDGRYRPVKPGVRLLAHGVSGRVAQLRGLGNAIVPQVAAEFVSAFMESLGIKPEYIQ